MLKNKITAYAARIVVTIFAAGALALGSAAIAAADTTSIFNAGDSNLGVSVGTTGGSASLLGNVLTVDGFPKSTTTLTGMGYAYTATTDYNYEGGIEHTSSLTTDPASLSFTNYFKLTPMEGLDQNADVRLGSTQLVCTDFVCKIAP